MDRAPKRPSPMWTLAVVVCGALALASIAAAWRHQTLATRPVGEGELFLSESRWAAARLEEAQDPDEEVRRIRNALEVESVALVDAEGRIRAATSRSLVGTAVDQALLLRALEGGRFAALAAPVEEPIAIDEVVEWDRDDVLYEVLHPVEGGEGVLISYDIAELLERRARTQGIQSLTMQLLGLAAVLGVVTVILLAGRQGALRRIQEASRQAEFLEARSRELETHNRALQEAREQAERALALAEETNRIRSEFVLMINHELRTPLTGVVTGAELLAEEGLDDDDRKAVVADMVRDGRRLRDLIAQMLAVARIENRGLSYTLRDTGVSEVLDRVTGMTSRVTIPPLEESPSVRTDPDALAQLLSSLADNAYTHGAAHVQIRVLSQAPEPADLVVGDTPERAVFFVIEDDGPGIDPEFLPRAFEKFEKQSRSSGTGLGLYVARLMVEAMEGSIEVSTNSEGTRMSVAVPISLSRVEVAA